MHMQYRWLTPFLAAASWLPAAVWAAFFISTRKQLQRVSNWLFLASFMLLGATAQAGSWTTTGSLNTGRAAPFSTVLLPDGKVMVVGGSHFNNGSHEGTKTVELYVPTTGIWSYTSPMSIQRYAPIAVLLPNGKILAAGGGLRDFQNLCSAEIYNPTTATWSATGNMRGARVAFNAVVLLNGKVLIVGGANYGGVNGCGGSYGHLATAELYDPTTGTWASTGSMHAGRDGHTTSLLPNGKVLVTGGYDGNTLATAELYDPTTDNWTYTSSMHEARHRHTATVLSNGKVLVAGGGSWNGGNLNIATAELYDTANSTWSITGTMNVPRIDASATLLNNGKVVVTGGSNRNDYVNPTATSEIYNPTTGTWSVTGSMSEARSAHSAALLNNGKVLIAGGIQLWSSGVMLSSAELYTPGPNSPTAVTNAPSVITATSARLSGTVNPNEAATTVTFDFGATTAYGTNIIATPASIAATAGATTVSTDKTGLICGTTYHYRVKATNSLGTSLGVDKVFTTSICPRDLTITSFGVTPVISQVGQALTVRVTVQNQGTMPAAGGTLSLWLNQAAVATCNAASDKTVAIGTLAAGTSKAFIINGLTYASAGNKTFRVFADSTCATAETNESNNQATRVYAVGMPDLTVTSITLTPTAPVHGGTFTVQVVVKNQGPTNLGSTSFVDLWLNQTTNQGCGATSDAWSEISALAAGASQTITFTGLTAGTAGNKTMRAFADSWCERVDSNRNNNQMMKVYTVQ